MNRKMVDDNYKNAWEKLRIVAKNCDLKKKEHICYSSVNPFYEYARRELVYIGGN